MFKKKCPKCGAKNDKARTSCIECGAPFLGGEKERTKGEAAESSARLAREKDYETVRTKDEHAPVKIIASYNRGKIQLTDRSIQIKRRFRRIKEIPYHSIRYRYRHHY